MKHVGLLGKLWGSETTEVGEVRGNCLEVVKDRMAFYSLGLEATSQSKKMIGFQILVSPLTM